MNDFERLFRDFVRYPERYWSDNQRQLTKFLGRKKKMATYYGWDENDFVRQLIGTANWRVSKKLCTYFFPSFGSSGSHLLQYIFSAVAVACPLGEVYLAPVLIDKLKGLSLGDRRLFMEAYHLGHATDPSSIFRSSVIINTVHKPTLQYFADWTNNYKTMLITRNPVDLVISRTFRKEEYRDYLGQSSVDDESYLQENIDKTVRFYNAAKNFDFNSTIRFEDIIGDSNSTAKTINSFLGNSVTSVGSVEDAVKKAVAGEDGTNKFRGDRVEVPEKHINFAVNKLSKVTKELGY